KLAAARPDDANSRLLLGIAEFKTGDAEGAKRDLQRCLTIDSHLADAHYYLGLMARREGNIDAARGELEEVVRTNPEHASAAADGFAQRMSKGKDVSNATSREGWLVGVVLPSSSRSTTGSGKCQAGE